MTSLKRLLTLVLSMSFIYSPMSHGDVMENSRAYRILQLEQETDYFIEVMNTANAEGHLPRAGQNSFVMDYALPITALAPDDFNVFIIKLMNRYMAEPTSRAGIWELVKQIHMIIGTDLTYTERVQSGPASFFIQGTWNWGGIFLLAGTILWKLKGRFIAPTIAPQAAAGAAGAAATGPGAAVVSQMETAAAQVATRGSLVQFGSRLVNSPLVRAVAIAGAAGAAAGGIEWVIQNNRVHRWNPLEIFNVAQTELAFHFESVRVKIETDYQALEGNNAAIIAQAPTFLADIELLLGEVRPLLEQFGALTSLCRDDYLFQQAVLNMPDLPEFADFRNDLMVTDPTEQCRQQVALGRLIEKLETLSLTIMLKMLTPPAAPQPGSGSPYLEYE